MLLRTIILLIFTASTLAGCANIPPTPPSMPPIDRILGPDLPDNPDQADQGALPYWQICMACHGDTGQGLTDEWRAKWGPDEMNCWQSRCHAANHPPGGFVFPHSIPAVIGANTLTRFNNGQELYDSIYTTMPWWNPGSLAEEQAWNLTAYLMKAHGALPEGTTLSKSNAAIFSLRPLSMPTEDKRVEIYVLIMVLSAAAVVIAIRNHILAIP